MEQTTRETAGDLLHLRSIPTFEEESKDLPPKTSPIDVFWISDEVCLVWDPKGTDF